MIPFPFQFGGLGLIEQPVTAAPPTTITFDPGNMAAGGVLSNGNLTLARTGGTAVCCLATEGRTTGKSYFEFHCDSLSVLAAVGLSGASGNLTNDLGQETDEYGYRSGGQSYLSGTFNTKNGGAWTTGAIIGVAIDFGAKKGWFSRAGVFVLSGDPAAGTGEFFSWATSVPMFPAAQVNSTSQITARFKAADLTYTPPSGFSPYQV